LKESKQNISGILLLNKSYGLSSNTALQKTKRIFNAAKAGHTGTLDPLATGLLPICFGEATKFSSFLLDSDKEYIATIKLGSATTTYDAEGEVTATSPVTCSQAQILDCINSFLGKIIQYPPIYSALKVNGRALYDYARNKEQVEIKSREVTIHELELIDFISEIELTLRVLSSKGTYIRTLAHDIGQKLGCGAHLSGLVRTKTNHFNLQQAYTLDELANKVIKDLVKLLLPVDALVSHLDKIELSDAQYAKIKNGNPCELLYYPLTGCNPREHSPVGQTRLGGGNSYHQDDDKTGYSCQKSRIYYNSIFLGVAMITENGMVKPLRLCNTAQMPVIKSTN
jgi:tRNA pseudouridine55 synthase